MVSAGGSYQIQDSSGAVKFSSTSSSATFNWLLGASGKAVPYDSVFVSGGSYLIDKIWYVRVNHIYLMLSPNAFFIIPSNFNDYMLQIGGNSIGNAGQTYGTDCIVNGGNFDGNAVNQYHGDAISYDKNYCLWYDYQIGGIIIYGQRSVVMNTVIHNQRQWGIWVSGSYSGCMYCLIYEVGWNGFSTYQNSGTGTVTQAFCVNSEISRCSDCGMTSQSFNTVFAGNNVHDISPWSGQIQGSTDSYWGISWEGSPLGGGGTGGGNYAVCAGNKIDNCLYNGICLSDSSNSYTIVSGNSVTGTTHNGILLLEGGSNNIISYNTLVGCNTVGINIYVSASTGNTIYGNTITGSEKSINDGGTGTLYSAPSIVTVTVTASPNAGGVVTAGATTLPYVGTSPYITYGTVGSSIALVATPASGYTFSNWSDGGAQSHAITLPSSNVTYTATFSSGPSPATTTFTFTAPNTGGVVTLTLTKTA